MTIDVGLMKRVLAKVKADGRGPGTAHRFDGWAVKLSNIPVNPLVWAVLMEDLPVKIQDAAKKALFPAARLVPVYVAAMVVLGLTRTQAAELFDAENTVARIEELVATYTA